MNNKLAAITMGAVMMSGSVPAFAAEVGEDEASAVVAEAAADAVEDVTGNDAASADKVSAGIKDDAGDEISQQPLTIIQDVAGVVKHILISGNEKASYDDIMKHVTHIKIGDEYNRDVVAEDVQAIAESGLVQGVKAKALLSNGELYVVFEVQDISEVKSLTFTGNTILNAVELSDVVSLKVGEEFTSAAARQDAEKIRNAYAMLGYVAIVDGVNNNSGAVTYHIREAKVGDVLYEGNKKTKNWVLDKFTSPYLKKGELLRSENLQKAYKAVSESGFFNEVKIDVVDSEESGVVNLVFNLTDGQTGAWNLGGAYSGTYGAEFVGGIYDRNLGGTAKSFSLDVGVGSERDHYSITYTDPFWKKSNTTVYAKAFKTDKSVDTKYYEYDEGHTGGEIGFKKPVSSDKRTSMYANVRFDKIDVDDQKRGPELESFQENSVTLGVVHDNRNKATGSGSVFDGAITSSLKALGSDVNFTKFVATAKGYKRLSKRDMLAARSVVSYSPDNLPGVEQFTIGGSTTVRGLKEDEQRGDKSVLASVELRHNFTDKFQGVLFADAGKAWSDVVKNDIATSAGVGVRVTTALGILRFDVAKAEEESPKCLFGIGQNF